MESQPGTRQPRQQYTDQFRADAVSLVIHQNYTRGEAASSLGVSKPLLSKWVLDYKKSLDQNQGAPIYANGQSEVVILRQENRRLKQDRAILKKVLPLLIRQAD